MSNIRTEVYNDVLGGNAGVIPQEMEKAFFELHNGYVEEEKSGVYLLPSQQAEARKLEKQHAAITVALRSFRLGKS